MIDKNKKYKIKTTGRVIHRILCTDRVTGGPQNIIATLIDELGEESPEYYSEDELEEVKPERWVDVYWEPKKKKYAHSAIYEAESDAKSSVDERTGWEYVGTRKLGDDE